MIDFARQVLERSHQVPVVVDFWAAWCAPCRTLGPIIEGLAERAAGKWELVKLDTEQQPQVAADYGIQGIPAVKMFHRGEVIGEFVGALPAPQIESWLQTHLPDPQTDRLDAILSETEGDRAERVRRLEAFRSEHPELPQAGLHLAHAVLFDDPPRARALAAEARSAPELDEAAADLEALADLMGETSSPEKLAVHLDGARRALREDDLDCALEHLIDSVMVDRHFGEELARRAAVALFRRLGQDHELTARHQRRLGMALNP